MHPLLRRFLLVGVALTLTVHGALAQGLPRTAPEEVGLSASRLERLTEALEGFVDNGQLAGAVAIVVRRGRVAYLEGIGHRDREVAAPMRPNSIFRIASQTKALISVGVMMLQEEGKLTITDPVGRYLPEFMKTTVAEPDGNGDYSVVDAIRPITIRDLLTHTAGISYGGGVAHDRWDAANITGWYFAHRNEPIAETVSRMSALPFDAQPGTTFVYGYNTDILGALIERVSGQSLDVFMRRRVLDPLEMHDTSFYLPSDKADRLAVVYSATGDGIERAPDAGRETATDRLLARIGQGHYLDGPRKSFSGGAGFLSTASDYARFLQMMLNGGELDGVRLISRKTIELMTTDHLGDIAFTFGAGQGFGLGFFVVKEPGLRGEPGSIGEYGWYGAYHSAYWVDPAEELIVVYLTQLIPAALNDQNVVRALVYQSIID